jgi:peroxiredoxin
MKRIFMIILMLTGSLLAHAQEANLVITAKIKGLPSGLWIYYRPVTTSQTDSVKTIDDGFTIKTFVPKGQGNLYQFSVGKDNKPNSLMTEYLDHGVVELAGNGPLFNEIKASGSAFVTENNDFEAYIENDKSLEKSKAINDEYNLAYSKKDTATVRRLQPAINVRDSLQRTLFLSWVRNHPNSAISAYILQYYLGYNLSAEELEAELNKLTASARDNAVATGLKHTIDVDKRLAIGRPAPDFTQADTAGKPVALKDFRGKYVLVDFWASWCGPCRMENPEVVKTYLKFKSENFTILGVSLDKEGKKEAWLKAIHTDHLEWTQVSDLKYWKNDVARLYNVYFVPTNYLISPDGVIVGKNLHGDELDAKLAQLLKK